MEHRKTKYIAVFIFVGVFAGILFFWANISSSTHPTLLTADAMSIRPNTFFPVPRIGFEEKPSAQTGTLLLNMLGAWAFGFNETGPKLLQAIFQITALVLMFIAIRRLFGQGAAAVSVIVASVYLCAFDS